MKYAAVKADFDTQLDYDLAVVSVGYERRSSHLLRCGLDAKTLLAVAFEHLQVMSFDDNMEQARRAGAEVRYAGTDEDMSPLLAEWSSATTFAAGEAVRIAVDISSMTRQRLSSMILELERLHLQLERDVEVDFFYSPAAFTRPSVHQSGSLVAGPVRPEFAGRLRRTSLPVVAVIGLGYEPQRALGVFELLEPARAWAFRPNSEDRRFVEALARSNEALLRSLGDGAVLDYWVSSGVEILYALDSFLFSLEKSHRVVLLPMGPKIFALACLLLGLDRRAERPAVWRVGEARYGDPVDVAEDGSIVGIRVTFSESGVPTAP
jgi:hypothetical protein